MKIYVLIFHSDATLVPLHGLLGDVGGFFGCLLNGFLFIFSDHVSLGGSILALSGDRLLRDGLCCQGLGICVFGKFFSGARFLDFLRMLCAFPESLRENGKSRVFFKEKYLAAEGITCQLVRELRKHYQSIHTGIPIM